ncbi:DUF6907 domain-containing protein [Streptomyces atratus]|uniref:DUF6907 domain-containing protein n=1 Tax=Streptomyces atratus TaxID=1893 RepID=UPI0037AEBD8D
MHARVALEGVQQGDDFGWSADYLRARRAEHPSFGYCRCGEGGRQADERAAHRHGAVPRPRPGHPACPAWCTGHTEHPVECRVVLAHAGAEGVMTHGGERLRFAELVQYPYDWCARRRVGVHVELFGFARTLASAELYAPAAALVDHAAQLRALARHLSTRTRRGRRAARHAPCSPW